MLTFNKIFKIWMESSTLAVQTEGIRLASGPMLKIASGTYVNSFFRKVLLDGHLGIVGNKAPYAHLWEFKGVSEADFKKKRTAWIIEKRGALSPRSQKGVIIRAKNYNLTKSLAPRPVLRTALIHEMTGLRGRMKYVKLARDIGYAVVLRYSQMLSRRYGVDLNIQMGNAGGMSSESGTAPFAVTRSSGGFSAI